MTNLFKARIGTIMDTVEEMGANSSNLTKSDLADMILHVERTASRLRIMLNRGELDNLLKNPTARNC